MTEYAGLGEIVTHHRSESATAELRARHPVAELHAAGGFPDAQQATLLFVCSEGRVLLMRKLRGHGAELINAPGGKLEAGETPLDCALRETREEVGLSVLDARLHGELRFEDVHGERVRGWVFRGSRYRGEPVATAEADPLWVPADAIPYDAMWPGDRYWLPWLLRGESFRATLLCRGEEVLEACVSLEGSGVSDERCPG